MALSTYHFSLAGDWLAISCWLTNKWTLALSSPAIRSVTALSSKVLTSFASRAINLPLKGGNTIFFGNKVLGSFAIEHSNSLFITERIAFLKSIYNGLSI